MKIKNDVFNFFVLASILQGWFMAHAWTQPNPENGSMETLDVAARCAVSRRSSDRMRAIQALIPGLAPPAVAETFQAFLDHANASVGLEGPCKLLVHDNASWHKVKSPRRGRFEPLYLPPYSPDLNPIERLWLLVQAEWFTNWTAKTRPQLEARVNQALCWLMDR